MRNLVSSITNFESFKKLIVYSPKIHLKKTEKCSNCNDVSCLQHMGLKLGVDIYCSMKNLEIQIMQSIMKTKFLCFSCFFFHFQCR